MKSHTAAKNCAICHIDPMNYPNGTQMSDGSIKWRKVGKAHLCSQPCSEEFRYLQRLDGKFARA
jgi:hypothetical protein